MTAAHANSWAAEAVRRLLGEDANAPTPLRSLPLPAEWGVDVHLKDESAHPTGSLKHRLVRAMYVHAVTTGGIRAGMPVIAATGGAVAVAGAYFARLLDLPFIALVPEKTPPDVLARVERWGGECRVGRQPAAIITDEARALAGQLGGHFLDHYAQAGTAVATARLPTVADELFDQLPDGRPPVWIVVGAGTGATSAAIGHRLRRQGHPTRLAVADPENSAYFPAWASGCADYTTGMPSRIPGVGRPRVEPGFLLELVDLVVPVPDAAAIAATRWLNDTAGIAAGPATGTSLWAVCHLVARMLAQGVRGSVVTLIGDGPDPYRDTHLDERWVAAQGLDPAPHLPVLERFLRTGEWPSACAEA
jgi:cysteine synthase A